MKYILLIVGFISSLMYGSIEKKEILFSYQDTDLIDVINHISSLKQRNMILPMRADEKITAKLTWNSNKKMTLDEAWDLLGTFLDIAGYSIVPGDNFYEIVKNTKDISREPMPVYIGTDPEKLPHSNQRIRYITYLLNIKMETADEKENEIGALLKSLMLPETVFKVDPQTNALLIMGQSQDIRSIMKIITNMDRAISKENVGIIPLNYANSKDVADLFNQKILQVGNSDRYRLDAKKPSDASYFSKQVKIVSYDRTNKIVILGRQQAIDRMLHFIQHYIDVPPDKGQSILHVYQLQYLNATPFAVVLRNIIEGKKASGEFSDTTPQSTGDKKNTGPERFFEDVIIAVDTQAEDTGKQLDDNYGFDPKPETYTEKNMEYHGGNKLIIAARSDDWKRIEKLIQELDNPQPQVLLEVLIADLTIDDERALGASFRNPAKIPLPNNMNIQSGQFPAGIIPDTFEDPQTIGAIKNSDGTIKTAADTLRFYKNNSDGSRTDAASGEEAGAVTAISGATPGSTILSLSDKDGKTWGIANMVKVIDNSKILAHPHVIATNNKAARIENTETRLLDDKVSITAAAPEIKKVPVSAEFKVSIKPRINISEDDSPNTVNMQIAVYIDQYEGTANDTRSTRKIFTNATVNSGDILAVGGLIRTNAGEATSKTPILADIPLIGWAFKNKRKTIERTNLTVFISPTVIEPRQREGMGEYTKDYLKLSENYENSGLLFDSLKDPITRWFFNDSDSSSKRFSKKFMKYDPNFNTVYENGNTKPTMPNEKIIRTNVSEKRMASALQKVIQDVDNPFASVASPAA